MENSEQIEETFTFAKSSAINFIKAAMCYEYIYAQNVKANAPFVARLQDMETLAITTLKQFSIPETQQDLEQIMVTFAERVSNHLRACKQ